MEKRQYIYPKTDVLTLNTSKLMAFTDNSENDPAQAGTDTNQAPAHRTEVF